MNVVIQRAGVDDAEAIAGVQTAAVRVAYRDHFAQEVLDPPEKGPGIRLWGKWLERSQTSTALALVDGTVTGFYTLHPKRGEPTAGGVGELEAIHVLPSHWRRGIGRLLCEQAVADARTRGFREVAVWTLEANDRARRFYEALGFCEDGETRVFLERPNGPLRELLYRRNISTEPVYE